MSNLLIIGAGASRAEAIAGGIPDEDLPPLDLDFFQRAEAHATTGHLETVKGYLKKHYSIDLQNGSTARMEEAFGLIFADTLADTMPSDAKNAFSALCRIYSRVIASTTNKIKVEASGPLASLIEKISSTGPLTIITFNQDVIIEKAITEVSKKAASSLWYPDSGYEMNFKGLTLPSGRRIRSFEEGNGLSSSIIILKMHGSLNWYTRTPMKNHVPSRLNNNKEVYCTRRTQLSSDMTYKTGNTHGRKTMYTWPLIVPPIFEKGSFIGKVLSGVWNSAFDAIKNSEKIYVYGYSFPAADQQSEVFFRRATIANNNKTIVSIINPDFYAAERAYKILKPSVLLTCISVDELINSVEFHKSTVKGIRSDP